jgi:hypothetical protein
MYKSKWIKILVSIGVVFLIVFVVIPPFTRRWYRNHSMKYAPPVSVSSWKKFTSAEGKFSIWFPGNPEETNIVIEASNVRILQPCFFAWADPQNEYAVNYGDYPKSLNKMKPEQQFDICQSGVAREIGKIIYQTNLQFENYPARDLEFVAGGKANYSGRMRLILVNERIYQLVVIFLTTNPHPADREIFFGSFHIQN